MNRTSAARAERAQRERDEALRAGSRDRHRSEVHEQRDRTLARPDAGRCHCGEQLLVVETRARRINRHGEWFQRNTRACPHWAPGNGHDRFTSLHRR